MHKEKSPEGGFFLKLKTKIEAQNEIYFAKIRQVNGRCTFYSLTLGLSFVKILKILDCSNGIIIIQLS